MFSDNNKIKNSLVILWIFVSLNYIYCDVLSAIDPTYIKAAIDGSTAVEISPALLLFGGILLEIAFSMILVSYFTKPKIGRMINILASILFIIVQLGSLFVDEPTIYYIFFSIIEIACMSLICFISLKWRHNEK